MDKELSDKIDQINKKIIKFGEIKPYRHHKYYREYDGKYRYYSFKSQDKELKENYLQMLYYSEYQLNLLLNERFMCKINQISDEDTCQKIYKLIEILKEKRNEFI